MDFYGKLLTDKQRDALELYYGGDYSLSEIADDLDISRQGVRDSIKRGEHQLLEMEEKLGLRQRFSEMSVQIDEIIALCEKISAQTNEAADLSDRIRQICLQLKEEL